MLEPARILERMTSCGLSQAEVARQVGLSQQAIGKLVSGQSRTTGHIGRLARVLRTTTAYLEGEIDDPDADAPPPHPVSRIQLVTAQIALPSEDALTEAFEALLSISRDMNECELARELAKRLPIVLRVSAGALATPLSVHALDPPGAEEAPHDAQPAPRIAARSR